MSEIEIEHKPRYFGCRMQGSNRIGTAVECDCGWYPGVVTNESPSRGGRKIAQAAFERHVAAAAAELESKGGTR